MDTRKLNLIGKKFNNLLVLEQCASINKRNSFWICKCDCGKTITVRGTHITNNNTKSCGCIRRSKYGERTKKAAWANFKFSAKKRGYKVNISFDQWYILTQEPCNYCGEQPNSLVRSKCNNGDFIHSGIDRIDNTKDYSLDNVVSCCKKCNIAKAEMSSIEFKNWIKTIYNYFIGAPH